MPDLGQDTAADWDLSLPPTPTHPTRTEILCDRDHFATYINLENTHPHNALDQAVNLATASSHGEGMQDYPETLTHATPEPHENSDISSMRRFTPADDVREPESGTICDTTQIVGPSTLRTS